MVRRMKRQTKKRHSVVWPERSPRIRYRHNVTEIVWWEAPPGLAAALAGTVVALYEPQPEELVTSTITGLKGRTFWTGHRA